MFKLPEKAMRDPATDRLHLSELKVPLYPHQPFAAFFMLIKGNSTVRGGILGDGMGLGKTPTALTAYFRARVYMNDVVSYTLSIPY